MKFIMSMLAMLALLFVNVAWAGCTCVDLDGDGIAETCICVEDDPVDPPEVPEPEEPTDESTSYLSFPAQQYNTGKTILDFLISPANAQNYHSCVGYYWPGTRDQITCPWGYRYLDPCSINSRSGPSCYESRTYILNNLCNTAVRCN